jgi:hypothetical protein
MILYNCSVANICNYLVAQNIFVPFLKMGEEEEIFYGVPFFFRV